MFAIFEDGSHQYRVQPGDTLFVDYREAVKAGESLSFDRVLAAGTDTGSAIGRPVVEGAVVRGEVLADKSFGPKLEVGKFKRRKGYIRHTGHKQPYTSIRITAIEVPGLATESVPAAAGAAQ